MIEGTFNPRFEVPALLESIGELAEQFRDVYEGSCQARGMLVEAQTLMATSERLFAVLTALTATALVGAA